MEKNTVVINKKTASNTKFTNKSSKRKFHSKNYKIYK